MQKYFHLSQASLTSIPTFILVILGLILCVILYFLWRNLGKILSYFLKQNHSLSNKLPDNGTDIYLTRGITPQKKEEDSES